MNEQKPVASDVLEAAVEFGSSQFLKGFIVGVLVIVVLGVALVQFLFLQGPFNTKRKLEKQTPVDSISKIYSLLLRSSSIPSSLSSSSTPKLADIPNSSERQAQRLRELLLNSNYNVLNHGPETCDWLNVIVVQVLTMIRHSASFHADLIYSLDSLLNQHRSNYEDSDQAPPPSLFDRVSILNCHLGNTFPRINAAQVNYSETGRVRAELDLSWESAGVCFGLETMMLLNFPFAGFASLPIQLSLTLNSIRGTFSFEIFDSKENAPSTVPLKSFPSDAGNPSSSTTPVSSSATSAPTRLDARNYPSASPHQNVEDWVNSNLINAPETCTSHNSSGPLETTIVCSFLNDFEIDLDVSSLLGERTKIKDLPKLKEMLIYFIKSQIEEEIVWPNHKEIRIPLMRFGQNRESI